MISLVKTFNLWFILVHLLAKYINKPLEKFMSLRHIYSLLTFGVDRIPEPHHSLSAQANTKTMSMNLNLKLFRGKN